jgi:hypothetical protein
VVAPTDRSLTVARLHFRLTNVALDEEEEPQGVTAVVDEGAYEVIAGILGEVNMTDRRRGGTEITVALPINDVRKLFHECGKINGLDPRYDKGSSEIYDSLTMVFYGIMQE